MKKAGECSGRYVFRCCLWKNQFIEGPRVTFRRDEDFGLTDW